MDKFEKEITEKVVNELKKRKIKQIQLIRLCREAGVAISQPDISKLYSGKKALNMHQFAVICKVLKMPMETFVWTDSERRREDFCSLSHSSMLHDAGRELAYYAGKYYFYYLSTASGEDKILKGELLIEEKGGFYVSNLILDTGAADRQGTKIFKKYVGRILVSSSLGAAYLIFKNEAIGEICTVCFRHRKYSVKSLECRVGLALTMSAGEEKVPTAHRCLLLYEEISEDQIDELRPWLNLIHDNISIEKDTLQRFLEEEIKRNPQYERQIRYIGETAAVREIAELSIENLHRQLPLDRSSYMGFLSSLYRKACLVRNYKVTQSDDVRFFELINSIHEKESG